MADVILCQRHEVPPPGGLLLCEVGDGLEIVLVNVDGELFAIDNKCPHTGGPLADGELNGPMLECPWHFAIFDVRTGGLVEGLASRPAKTFPVTVTDKEVLVTLPDDHGS